MMVVLMVGMLVGKMVSLTAVMMVETKVEMTVVS